MALSSQKQLALYLLLSHPLSILRIKLDLLPPADSMSQAALDVANLTKSTLNLNLSPDDITDIQTYLAGSGAIRTDGRVFKLTGNPVLLAKALDASYDPGTGCPDVSRAADIFTALA